MKKVLAAILAAALAFSCTGCFGLSKEEKLDKIKDDAKELKSVLKKLAKELNKADSVEDLDDEYAEINGVAIWDDDADIEDADDYAKMSDLLKQYKLGDADDFFEREIDGDTYYIIVGDEEVKAVEEDSKKANGVVLNGDSSVVLAVAMFGQEWDGIVEYDDAMDSTGGGVDSAKLCIMESDCTTVNMLIKEAVNNRLARQKNVKYNGIAATDDSLTVGDVLKANDMKYDDSFFERKIGGKTYKMVATADRGALTIKVDTEGTALSADTTIKSIAQDAGLEY